jgi:hypothetical protein
MKQALGKAGFGPLFHELFTKKPEFWEKLHGKAISK